MAELNIKHGNKIILPIRVGETVYFINENGETCKSVPRMINKVAYNEGYLYITFTTKNSIYENLPVKVVPSKNFINGQVIKAGEVIPLDDDTYNTIKSIYEVNSKGIIVATDDNKWLIGAIYEAKS
jgi:hypothetical protein